MGRDYGVTRLSRIVLYRVSADRGCSFSHSVGPDAADGLE